MAGRLRTEKGLGDGIKSLFQPIFDALNTNDDGTPVADSEKLAFPETGRRILNAFFSAAVQSSFEQKACSDDRDASFDDIWLDEIGDVMPAEFDLEASDAVAAAMTRLDPERQELLRKALAAEPATKSKRKKKTAEPVVFAPPAADAPDGCFNHTGTSATISRGLQSGTSGFDIATGAAKIRINLSYSAAATIVGQEPEIGQAGQTAAVASGYVPPGQAFTGQVTGNKQLTVGGLCGDGRCTDEYVTGTAKITILFGMKAAVAANVPAKLKDAVPALGVEAGLVSVVVYSFQFLHYPRTAPAGIPDPGA